MGKSRKSEFLYEWISQIHKIFILMIREKFVHFSLPHFLFVFGAYGNNIRGNDVVFYIVMIFFAEIFTVYGKLT